MDSQRLAVCGQVGSAMGRWWRRAAVGLAVVLTVGLVMLTTVHLSTGEEGHVNRLRDRLRRSSNTTSSVRNATPTPSGAVFTHWGRSDCPPSSQIVYKGIVGCDQSGHTGGGGEYLCLSDEPEWLIPNGGGTISHMYGVEYQDRNDVGMAAGQNAVCAVCQSTRTNKVMIPGRTSCVAGWTREYYGYLMSEKSGGKSSRNYICVDKEAQADWASNGKATNGAGQLYHVYGHCGALPCPKYKGTFITCVLCTR